jgi:hypothetical protein
VHVDVPEAAGEGHTLDDGEPAPVGHEGLDGGHRHAEVFARGLVVGGGLGGAAGVGAGAKRFQRGSGRRHEAGPRDNSAAV